MPAVDREAFEKKIESGSVGPVTLLFGEETLLIDECVDRIVAKFVDPAMRGFNLDVVDGAKADVRDVLAKASSFPMMSERRVVVVRTMERFAGGEKAKEVFAAYLGKPLESTHLVLVADEPDFRRKPFTDLKRLADVVEFKSLWERDIPGWIIERAAAFGMRLDLDAARSLMELVGTSLLALQQELTKLQSFLGDRTTATREDVLSVAGASRGYTVYDLQNAIGRRDFTTAATVLRKMLGAGENPIGIIVMLTRFFSQIARLRELKAQGLSDGDIAAELRVPGFYLRAYAAFLPQFSVGEVEAAFDVLRDTDRNLKTSAGEPAAQMELLVHTLVRSRALNAAREAQHAMV